MTGKKIFRVARPGVPAFTQIMGVVFKRDWVTANAIENILSRPKKIPSEEFRWTNKPDYGQVPEYLKEIKKRVQDEYAYIESQRPGQLQLSQVVSADKSWVMPESERTALLDGLKKRWGKLNSEYQNSTHVVKLDTIGKARRKENFEEQLAAIEKYIERIGKGTIIVTGA